VSLGTAVSLLLMAEAALAPLAQAQPARVTMIRSDAPNLDATAPGLTIPRSLRLRADQVIQ
jgi:hypothetical protein